MGPSESGLHSSQGSKIGKSVSQEWNARGCRRQGRAVFWARRDGHVLEACLLQNPELTEEQGLSLGLKPSLVSAHTEGASSGQDHTREFSTDKLFGNWGHWL